MVDGCHQLENKAERDMFCILSRHFYFRNLVKNIAYSKLKKEKETRKCNSLKYLSPSPSNDVPIKELV